MSASTRRKESSAERIGRYVVYDEIAAGGMATVHLGRLEGPVGFSRTVAVKQLHSHLARDPEFLSMFLDEARLAARIRHPNVGATIDVVAEGNKLLLVMEYVHGASLARLVASEGAAERGVAPRIAAGILVGVLQGLHAAHETRSETGAPLEIVHRDVSPQNVMVGVDGVARVLDFGIAKAAREGVTTRDGRLKGKLSYMSPEQVRGERLDRRTDVYAAAVVLWEVLTGKQLFPGDNPIQIGRDILERAVPRPSSMVRGIPPELDDVVRQGLSREKEDRFSSARAMAMALETSVAPATSREIGEWVEASAGSQIRARAELVRAIDSPGGTASGPQGDTSEQERPSQESTHVDIAVAPAAPSDHLASPAAEVSGAQTEAPVVGALVPRKRPLTAVAVVAALAVGAALLLLASRLLSRSDETSKGTPPPVTSSEHAPEIAQPTALPNTVPGATAPVTSASASALHQVEPPRPPRSRVSANVTERARPTPLRPEPAKRSPGCDPPFVLEGGIKRYKPECIE